MRCFCVAMLLASAIGSADVAVTAQRQRPAGGQAQADIPQEFAFLFLTPEQSAREAAKRPTYVEDLWKGLPYDSISLDRGGSGCVGACPWTTLILYRATVAGIVAPPRIAPDGRQIAAGELRGRAELHIEQGASSALAGLPGASLQPLETLRTRVARMSEGSVDLHTFANLSYLLHRARFLTLPDEYDCRSCPQDRTWATLSVVAGGKTKAVTDYGLGRPVELWAIQQALDSVSDSIQWTPK
jgi:hypothetical protein